MVKTRAGKAWNLSIKQPISTREKENLMLQGPE